MNKFILTGLGFLLISAGLFSYYLQFQNPYKELKSIEKTAVVKEQKVIEEKDFRLKIDPISVEAPIILDVNGNDEEDYLSALQKGVAQLAGTSLPGQPGNSFIFGHSSYYFYDEGSFKYIFSRLSDIEIGNEIEIISNKNTYKYKVFEKKSVNPEQIEVANKLVEGKKETLTLMTCTPTGTAWYRLIVIAEQNP